jgi:hypothetical protein
MNDTMSAMVAVLVTWTGVVWYLLRVDRRINRRKDSE